MGVKKMKIFKSALVVAWLSFLCFFGILAGLEALLGICRSDARSIHIAPNFWSRWILNYKNGGYNRAKWSEIGCDPIKE
mgnify:CR=1 FL=1